MSAHAAARKHKSQLISDCDLEPVAQGAGSRYRRPVTLLRQGMWISVAALVAFVSGCGFDDASSPSPTGSAVQVCVEMDRAYTAWDAPSRPITPDDFLELSERQLREAHEAGKQFVGSVPGPEDTADTSLDEFSDVLAGYNLELGVVIYSPSDEGRVVTREKAEVFARSGEAVQAAYRSWREAVCG